ncbi:hypothetical protein EJV47_04585 [Hymenobacter gummosus]|uniref:PD-(D/E)XK nuclease family protein n=1 Tax=Hymenobacter gummosus TaxID=1776032 RepID=A0A431U6Q4_9BACT|nr:PD-(D/E)XK nuclease family protein [Hymenobacter gummosus]RTQ52304.1 hypothetical protein EJV47_04585 [Hymenobacter gummosus]
MIDIPETPGTLIAFLERYKALTHQHETQRLVADQLAYARLLEGWQVLQQLHRRQQQLAPAYNVFSLLRNLTWDETRLHSPMLADLLYPRGAHGQGPLFYDALLEQLRQLGIQPNRYQGRDAHFYHVATEVDTGDGFIDVLLTYRGPDARFAVAIENKIYAADQDRQLARYQRYLEAQFGSRSLLLYLTPWRRDPDEASLTVAERQQLTEAGRLRCITYYDHVLPMLQGCLAQVQAPVVRQILEQYIQAIENL